MAKQGNSYLPDCVLARDIPYTKIVVDLKRKLQFSPADIPNRRSSELKCNRKKS